MNPKKPTPKKESKFKAQLKDVVLVYRKSKLVYSGKVVR